MVGEHERLGASFTLVVTGARPNGVDVAPVLLRLRVLFRVTVDLGGGGLEYARPHPLGKPQHVEGPHDIRLYRLYRVVLIMHRGCGAREVVYLIHFKEHRLYDIMPYQLEKGVGEEVRYVLLAAGEEVVEAQHLVALP